MEELQFIIVNSKRSIAETRIGLLKGLVSFDVYQETEEEPVWSIMEGGKDDMFVYDRCGRLSYYIPFPLSILDNEQPTVSVAVQATYFRSPCGETCDRNGSYALDEFFSEEGNEFSDYNSTSMDTTTDETNITNDPEYIVDDVFYENSTELSLYDYADIGNQTDYLALEVNSTNDKLDQITDEIELEQERKNKEAQTFFNSLYRFFWNIDENVMASKQTTDETQHNLEVDNNKVVENQNDTENENTKLDHCPEINEAVCQNWSKRKLLHAQKCCSENTRHNKCRNYGRKRCKKVQPLLKCCLKTSYNDETATENNVVCCKNTENGKLCYVSETSQCGEDEYIEERHDTAL